MGLRENMLKEPVSELATREAVVVSPSTPIREAIEKMREKRLGCVFVAREDGIPIGIFTERDVMTLLVHSPTSLDEGVENHMTRDWPSVKISDPISTILEVMKQRSRYVCVTDDEGRVVALSGQRGVVEYITDHYPQHVLTQDPGSKPLDQREGA